MKAALLVLFCIVMLVAIISAGLSTHPSDIPPRTVLASPDAARAAAVSLAAALNTPKARIAYADNFDQQMLDAGIESTTKANGPKNTTLYIKYALAGRVTANQLGRKLDFGQLKQLGFKKVVFTNEFEGELGHSFTWTVDK